MFTASTDFTSDLIWQRISSTACSSVSSSTPSLSCARSARASPDSSSVLSGATAASSRVRLSSWSSETKSAAWSIYIYLLLFIFQF
ncbi:ORF134 [Saltwater crocodilepox virus]|nr:hypothetical protein [Saltwater crocodilepox virus]AVD69469.1 hypothetical protein [Saltwater crocodilepox virus]QGT46572.1 ORF134 [Saltwater crocodilepox virus]QGT46788.1 ORF134 [Saltwater crocodilepox virus]QGT47004.1 ORF134 [Saltwater crocodilepox virus]